MAIGTFREWLREQELNEARVRLGYGLSSSDRRTIISKLGKDFKNKQEAISAMVGMFVELMNRTLVKERAPESMLKKEEDYNKEDYIKLMIGEVADQIKINSDIETKLKTFAELIGI